MAKKCVSCEEEEATLCVKGTSECYCKDCAIEHFGDLDMLIKIEEEAKQLKNFIDNKLNNSDKNEKTNEELIDVTIKKKKK